MTFMLTRKINRAKWGINDYEKDCDFPGDPITSCLRTTNNKLSTWRIDKDEEIDKVFLAILTTQTSIDTMDIVIYDVDILDKNDINYKQEDGVTGYKDMLKRHYDLLDITYKSLGTMTFITYESVKRDRIYRRTRTELVSLLQKAIHEKIIEEDDLPDQLKSKIKK